MDKNQKLQLKVLMKTRINQLNALLKVSSTDAEQLQAYVSEAEALKSNLLWLETGKAGLCFKCGCDIKFSLLVAYPERRSCEKCDDYGEVSLSTGSK